MSTSIRKAQIADADSLAELLREFSDSQGHRYWERLNAIPIEDVQRQVSEQLRLSLAGDSHTLYLAEDDHGILEGYVAVHWLPYLFLPGPEGYISELFIRRQSRGRGIGARLLEAVKEEAARRGVFRLSLLNYRQRESYQRGFYPKHGWEERPDMSNFVFLLEKSG